MQRLGEEGLRDAMAKRCDETLSKGKAKQRKTKQRMAKHGNGWARMGYATQRQSEPLHGEAQQQLSIAERSNGGEKQSTEAHSKGNARPG